ncbi:MAG: DUF7526 family protein [archaeon]
MPQTVTGDVLYAIPPDEVEAHDLQPAVAERAGSRYVLVCRQGGKPSLLEQIRRFLLRKPIEAVTIVSDEPAEEGEEIRVTVRETEIPRVYETTSESSIKRLS